MIYLIFICTFRELYEEYSNEEVHAWLAEEKTSVADLVTKYDRQVEDLVLARLRPEVWVASRCYVYGQSS